MLLPFRQPDTTGLTRDASAPYFIYDTNKLSDKSAQSRMFLFLRSRNKSEIGKVWQFHLCFFGHAYLTRVD